MKNCWNNQKYLINNKNYDIKSAAIEHPKTLGKFSNSFLYNEKTKLKKKLMEKKDF